MGKSYGSEERFKEATERQSLYGVLATMLKGVRKNEDVDP